MNSNEIQRRQNDEKLLKIQYAARKHYNFAEKLNHYAWLLCLVSAFSIFLPDSCPAFIYNGVPFTANLIALCSSLLVNHNVKLAAKLRKYFDANVLNICPSQFSDTEIREIKEIAGKAYSKNPSKAEIQMANTGKDSPPGVSGWYVFPEQCIGISAKFECQRQNVWWNSKMSHKRLIVTIFAAVLVGIAFLLFLVSNDNTLTTLLCFSGLIIKIVERLIENGKYIKVSMQIDGALQAIETRPTEEGVEKLQNLIDERRSIAVLELNCFHKKSANILSKVYEERVL